MCLLKVWTLHADEHLPEPLNKSILKNNVAFYLQFSKKILNNVMHNVLYCSFINWANFFHLFETLFWIESWDETQWEGLNKNCPAVFRFYYLLAQLITIFTPHHVAIKHFMDHTFISYWRNPMPLKLHERAAPIAQRMGNNFSNFPM